MAEFTQGAVLEGGEKRAVLMEELRQVLAGWRLSLQRRLREASRAASRHSRGLSAHRIQ